MATTLMTKLLPYLIKSNGWDFDAENCYNIGKLVKLISNNIFFIYLYFSKGFTN